jgi:hypothetical protein
VHVFGRPIGLKDSLHSRIILTLLQGEMKCLHIYLTKRVCAVRDEVGILMTESSNRAEAKRAGQAVDEGGRDTLASLLSAFAAVLRTFPDLVLDEDMRYAFP